MSRQQSSRFTVACSDCEVDVRTDDPNEVVAFFRRHRRVTGHEPTLESVDVPRREVPEEGDVKDVIRAIEPEFEDGVPVGVVAAVMHGRGVTIAETLDRIYEVRMRGGIYEPRDDHLRAF